MPSTNIWMKWKVVEDVHQFKYLDGISTIQGLNIIRLAQAQAHSAMTRLAVFWREKKPSVFLQRSFVLAIMLHGCDGWTLPVDIQK